MLTDSDLDNQRLALGALNSATHNKSDIIFPHLAQLIPLVMKESKINPALIREVQMGPFKHKVDDGLELRKVRCNQCRSYNLSNHHCRALTRPCILSWRAHTRV